MHVHVYTYTRTCMHKRCLGLCECGRNNCTRMQQLVAGVLNSCRSIATHYACICRHRPLLTLFIAPNHAVTPLLLLVLVRFNQRPSGGVVPLFRGPPRH